MALQPFALVRRNSGISHEDHRRIRLTVKQAPVSIDDRTILAAGAFARAPEITVAFSGHLTNARELRERFPASPDGDAGLVISVLKEHAPDNDDWIRELWGEFAIVACDSRADRLWLVRDRIGLHPLFIAPLKDGIAAATSIGQLLRVTGMKPEAHMPFVARFLGTHYRHFEHDGRATAFEGIERIPPGSACVIDAAGRHENRYWSLSASTASQPATEDEAAEQLKGLLKDAVERRVRDLDAQSAAFALSSGMDSSSVLGLASGFLGKDAAVYTSTFGAWEDDEENDAAETGRVFGAWRAVPIEPVTDFLATAQALHQVHDEPVCTVTWFWDYLVQQAAAKNGCRGFFGGLGGDELFAGEFEHFFFRFADLDESGKHEMLDHEIAEWKRLHEHPRYPKNEELVRETWRRMRGIGGKTLPDQDRFGRNIRVLAPELRAMVGMPLATENPFPDYLRNRLWQDLNRETTLPCARAAWQNARAFGHEIRYPFLDHRVAEFAFSLPGEWKIRDGVTKVILRRAMKDVLPQAVTARTQKTGWTSPAWRWFAGETLDRVEKDDEWLMRSFYDRAVRRALFTEHRTETADHSMLFWQMVALEAWWRRWFAA